jgi:carboxyl-terminal processing protease
MKRGQKEDTAVSNSEPVLAGAPIAVLVNGSTASGAELLAAALQEGRKALVVGSRTFGKWTVQTIDELGNGYAAKYTVGRFVTPGGRSFDGEGMPPDVQVDMDEKALTKAMTLHDPEPRIAADVQLRTAVELVTMRAR